MKKAIVILLTMLMVLMLIPSMALAAETTYRVWDSGQLNAALTRAQVGDTIYLYSNDYDLDATTIDKNITFEGESMSGVVIHPTANTGSVDDARGWILVNTGVTLTMKNLTLDGSGYDIFQAIRSHGAVVADNLTICNMIYPSVYGHGMALYGNGNVITNVTMHDIGRVGIGIYGTTTVKNFMYTAKGYGNILDYGIEVGTTADMYPTGTPFTVTISNVTITGNRGVVSGSTNDWGSSGILVSTYFYNKAGGTNPNFVTVNIDHANISDCSVGVDCGFMPPYLECSNTTITSSNFFGNEYDLIFAGSGASEGTMTATGNYYGGSAPVASTDEGLSITGLDNYVTSPIPMSQDTEVKAGVDPSYIIVIPASVDFGTLVKGSGTVTQEFDVTAQGVVIDNGAHINVAVEGPFVMKDHNGTGTVSLVYTLNNEHGLVSPPAAFASFAGNDTEDGVVSVDTNTITAAGSYKGTMQFTITYIG